MLRCCAVNSSLPVRLSVELAWAIAMVYTLSRVVIRGKACPGMKFFVDTADIGEIRELASTGLLDGVTTNPSLVAKTGRNFLDVVKEICAIVEGSVSAEVTATAYDNMVAEGRKLADLAENVCVKVPLTMPGLKACRTLSQAGARSTSRLACTAGQPLLAPRPAVPNSSLSAGRL